jgi:hypothetical protein
LRVGAGRTPAGDVANRERAGGLKTSEVRGLLADQVLAGAAGAAAAGVDVKGAVPRVQRNERRRAGVRGGPERALLNGVPATVWAGAGHCVHRHGGVRGICTHPRRGGRGGRFRLSFLAFR